MSLQFSRCTIVTDDTGFWLLDRFYPNTILDILNLNCSLFKKSVQSYTLSGELVSRSCTDVEGCSQCEGQALAGSATGLHMTCCGGSSSLFMSTYATGRLTSAGGEGVRRGGQPQGDRALPYSALLYRAPPYSACRKMFAETRGCDKFH